MTEKNNNPLVHLKGNEREQIGCWAPAVYAAAHVAKTIHQQQKDKGGNDYFSSHLMTVGRAGHTWKSQIVGFLHDAAEDTEYDVDTVLDMVRRQLHEWNDHTEDKSWMDEFDDGLLPCPDGPIAFPSEDDWKEMADALHVLNHHTEPIRKDYIRRFATNKLALQVKLNDMANNMDISRIPSPSAEDYERLERYKKEYEILIQMLRDFKGTDG